MGAAHGEGVSVDFLSREGTLGAFADVSADFRGFPCAEAVWGHMRKLGWKMRCGSDDPSLLVAATMSHRGKAFVVANRGARDVSFVPAVSGDMGAALHLYRFDSGRAPTPEDFTARPESNSDIRKLYLFVRDDCLYVTYLSVRTPPATLLMLR